MNTEVDTFLEFQKELFDKEQCFKVFEKCQVYFDDLNLVSFIYFIIATKKKKINNIHIFQDNLPVRNFHTNLVLEMLIFKFNGGTVCKNIDNNTTHVVIHSRYLYL